VFVCGIAANVEKMPFVRKTIAGDVGQSQTTRITINIEPTKATVTINQR
jgi:hypothetical protein